MFICIFIFTDQIWSETWCLYIGRQVFFSTQVLLPPVATLGHLSDFSVVQVAGVILVSPFTSIREWLVVAYEFAATGLQIEKRRTEENASLNILRSFNNAILDI